MKKFFTLVAFHTAVFLTTLAQISVEQSGRSVFGSYPPYNPYPDRLSAPCMLRQRDIGDTTATVQLFHRFDNDKPAYMNIGGNC